LREILAVKRQRLVANVQTYVRQIKYSRGRAREMELRHCLQKAVLLNGDSTWFLKRMYKIEVEARREIADARKRIHNIECHAFMYKCMELLRLIGENGIVMTNAVAGIYDGHPVRLVWDVHLAGPAIEVKIQLSSDCYWRTCGNATYYVTQRFNNRVLDIAMQG